MLQIRTRLFVSGKLFIKHFLAHHWGFIPVFEGSWRDEWEEGNPLIWSWYLVLGIFRRDPYALFLQRESEVEQTWQLTRKDKQRGKCSLGLLGAGWIKQAF